MGLLCESSEEEQALVPLLLNSNSHLELGRPTRLQNSRPKKTKATLCEQIYLPQRALSCQL